MQKGHHRIKREIFPPRLILVTIALLYAFTPGCLPAQKIAVIQPQPLFESSAPPTSAPAAQAITGENRRGPVNSASLADQENDDAVMAALASQPPKESAPAMPPATSGESNKIAKPLEILDDDRFPQRLIGPLQDPIFEPAADEESEELPEELPEELTADDQEDPLFTGLLEPLNLEEIDLPGPNDFGTLDGELVDTSSIDDLAAFSDPDTTYDLPVVINEQVKFFIDQYQTSHRRVFERWLARSGRFLPMIQEELAKAGMPQDLCYLPMIESGFRVNAYSPAKAVGAWQFIQSTGKMYDLVINKEIDERCDPVKSTRAAIRFLADLYEDFQSWPLAIAAYNAGGGRIRTAVQRTGSSDFWELAKSRFLVSETKYYVPKLLAAIIVAKNPERYGFEDVDYELPLAFETIQVPISTHLAAVALAAGIGLEDIYSLNRHLRRAVTPADRKFCELCVPVGTSELISRNLPLVRTTYTTKFKTHVVRKKDTTARISRKYGISQKSLLKINRLRVAKLKPGMRLQIPYQIKSYQLVDKTEPKTLASRLEQRPETTSSATANKDSRKPLRHKVLSGESLYQLSRRYKVTVAEISSWNNLRNSKLSVGQTLNIYTDQNNPRS